MKRTTIFFDYGGTLAYVDPSVERIWLGLLEELGQRADLEALEHALQQANEVASHLNIFDYHGRMLEYWRRYDAVVLDRLGIPDPEGMLAAAINTGFDRSNWYHLYPDVRGTLDVLRSGGYRLGIISNNVDDMLTRIQQLELAPLFDPVVYSQEAGADKPDPAIFQVALERAGCKPEESVHVGDSYEADVLGARSVGMTPILLDRNGQYPHADCLRVADLRQLPELLRAVANDSVHARTEIRRGGT